MNLHDLLTLNGETIRPHRFAGKPYPESVEQMCRNLLSQAIADGLARDATQEDFDDVNPQARTASDLAGMANLLAEYLRGAK